MLWMICMHPSIKRNVATLYTFCSRPVQCVELFSLGLGTWAFTSSTGDIPGHTDPWIPLMQNPIDFIRTTIEKHVSTEPLKDDTPCSLQQLTLAPANLSTALLAQRCADGLIKYVFHSLRSQRRTLMVSLCSQLLRHALSIRHLQHWSYLLRHLLVVPQMLLGANQQEGCAGNMILNLRNPFGFHVFKWWSTADREANEKHIRFGVR